MTAFDHHRVTESWMGAEVVTLSDLLRSDLRAVVVGINPAPRSVDVGHYYQGNAGRHLFTRLRRAGLMVDGDGYDDDRAFEGGIGFTDVVKRPTARATEVRPVELAHGRELLEDKLMELRVPLLIFTFKAAASTLMGRFDGNGLLGDRTLFGAQVFVMPGPYAARALVDQAVLMLKQAATI